MNGRRVPRYSQIVAELRQRIEAGELAPGERVPSTREITRHWGVAMATATKVLTELRQQGLVRAVPGVGTVVDAGSRPARPSRPAVAPPSTPPTPRTRTQGDGASELTLTTERIIASAIAVADAEGLAAVSMRRVATELGVATMSLYRHVADKDDLLMRMLDAAFAEWTLPTTAPAGWRERLELAARTLWAMFRQHPWQALALSVTRPQPIASAIPFTEWVLSALDGRGLDLQTMFTTHITLFNYVRGTAVNVEMEAEAESLSGMDSEEWMGTQEPKLQRILATGRFPTLERLVTAEYDFDLDELFEFGLQRLLDGLAPLMG
ncbi:TetR/AcrR family transcriptional regulator C-terminal domain-containing protein [Streptantibioticus rubrisoli]|uniref:TetR/AcrR family transcriptional regulator C-terminal domain-containing protein n=1 Tax=Streptantibioticus rubrisoli TaxID=1387313 RepID=A0ABT1PBD3_9ACTN|nr:TetR/AcrR family transcriptional regulator C-terminal domain-containing protein [Streptantibioticus rubrisoli]MCQ4042651.1 TetR/AcrR family transcriptional regulator C-terminal domain-containing protein [Streptantibioticus rubrisoli]